MVETISGIAGVALSLAFSYIPGLKDKFEELPGDRKRLIMLGILAGVSAAMFGIACAGFATDFGIGVTCDREGALVLVRSFFAAVIANQTAYALSPGVHE